MTSRNLSTLLCGVCECHVNLMASPVIHTPLLDRMSIQLYLGKHCKTNKFQTNDKKLN